MMQISQEFDGPGNVARAQEGHLLYFYSIMSAQVIGY